MIPLKLLCFPRPHLHKYIIYYSFLLFLHFLQLLIMILDDVSAVYSMDYDYIKKGNDQYLKPKKGHITYKLGGMKVQFDNLFNGDKLLGKRKKSK